MMTNVTTDSECEMEMYLNNARKLDYEASMRGSVRMKALMFEVNLPIEVSPYSPLAREDRGTGYNYGQKWSYLNGNNNYMDLIFFLILIVSMLNYWYCINGHLRKSQLKFQCRKCQYKYR